MGKSYRERIEAIMRRYRKAMEKAQAEFNRYGEVLPDTDELLTHLEDELAAVMI
jgi:hypothetical protein